MIKLIKFEYLNKFMIYMKIQTSEVVMGLMIKFKLLVKLKVFKNINVDKVNQHRLILTQI